VAHRSNEGERPKEVPGSTVAAEHSCICMPTKMELQIMVGYSSSEARGPAADVPRGMTDLSTGCVAQQAKCTICMIQATLCKRDVMQARLKIGLRSPKGPPPDAVHMSSKLVGPPEPVQNTQKNNLQQQTPKMKHGRTSVDQGPTPQRKVHGTLCLLVDCAHRFTARTTPAGVAVMLTQHFGSLSGPASLKTESTITTPGSPWSVTLVIANCHGVRSVSQ